jgi:hypothetical protein
MRFSRGVALALSFSLVSGCSLDLDIPQMPQLGGVKGVIDTQPATTHVPPTNLSVTVVRVDSGQRYETHTDATGAFEVDGLPPGTYLVSSQIPTFAPLLEGPYKVLAGQVNDVGTLTPAWLGMTPQQATLKGLVVIMGGANANETDAGERPSDAVGAKVSAFIDGNTSGTPIAFGIVDVFGTFSFSVPPGTYTVQVTHPYYSSNSRPGVVAPAGGTADLTADPLVMGLNPAQVSGTVMVEIDKSDAGFLAGIAVVSDTGVSQATDTNGQFVLGGLAAGTRTLRFTKDGFHDPLGSRTVVLGGAEKQTLPTFTMMLDRGDIVGDVVMADGTPLQQVTADLVGLSYSAPVVQGTPPSQGHFQLTGVPVGVYNVRASRTNYASAQSAAVTVTANATVNAGTLQLARIQGDFIIDDGDPTNTAGFTRTRNVTLVLSNLANAAQYRVAEGSSAALMSATYMPFSSNMIPYQLSTGDGLKNVFLQFKDASNNESPPLSSTVVLDTTPPSNPAISIAGGAQFTRISGSLPVTLTADDQGSGVALVRLSASSAVDMNGLLMQPTQQYFRDMSFMRPSSTDGVQSVSVQFVDNAGNSSAVATASIVIDTVAPTGTVTIARGPHATLNGYTDTVLVNLTETPGGVEPNGGYLLIRLANSAADLGNAIAQPVQTLTAWFLDPNGEGDKTVYYQFVDAAGNQSGSGMATIKYDITAPAVTATLTSAALTNNRTATIGLAASDANPLSPTDGLTVSESAVFSGATPTMYPASNSTSWMVSAGDGPKVIYVRVKDAAGNVGIANVMLTLDQTPPSGLGLTLLGTLGDGTPSTTASAQSAVSVQLTVSGATGYLLGDATLTACPTSGYTMLPANNLIPNYTPAGSTNPRTVHACFIDGAGNAAGPVSSTINIDTAAPSGCALLLTGYNASVPSVATSGALVDFTAQRDVTVTLNGCSDVPAQIFLTEGSVTCSAGSLLAWRPFTPGMTVTLSAGDGLKTVNGCVRDATLNAGSFVADGITLDSTGPTAPLLVTINNGAAYVNSTWISANGYTASVQGTATGATQWAIGQSPGPSSFVPIAMNPQTFTFTPASDGTRRIYAVFRDDLDNRTTATLFGDITFDGTPPAGGSFSISGNGFTNTPVVTVSLTPPAEPVAFQLVEATPPCTAASFATATDRTFVPTTTFVLSAAEGTKTLCVRYEDQAGNYAAPVVQQQVVLDVTPPTKPQIITSPTLVGPSVPASFPVTTSGPSTDTNLLGYQVIGGGFNVWTAQVPAGNTFNFTLTSNSAVEAGVPNVLRIRAVDKAGNFSAEDSVVVTVDTSPPQKATLNAAWVDNGNGEATLFWTPSTSPDVKGYLIYYSGTTGGGVTANYKGTGAIQGDSPVFVPTTPAQQTFRATLSGVANGSPLYVTVTAVDQVNQESVSPTAPTEVTLEPNFVSLDRVATVPLTTSPAGTIRKIIVQGHYAYIASEQNAGCASVGAAHTSYLTVVDLSGIKTPVQNGVPQTVSPPPVVFGPQAMAGVICPYTSGVDAAPDMAIDGPWLYWLAGPTLSMMSLAKPALPTTVYTVNVSAFSGGTATQVNVLADKLFISGSLLSGMGGTSQIVALEAGKLFDSDATTFPSAALQPTGDIIGSIPLLINWIPQATLITRDRLVTFYNNTSSMDPFLLANAIDNNIGTTWTAANSHSKETSNFPIVDFAPRASGNYLVTPSTQGLGIFNLNGLWNATVTGLPDAGPALSQSDALATLGISAEGSPSIEGAEIFLADSFSGGVRSINAEDYSAITNTGFNAVPPNFSRVGVATTYGTYLLTTSTSDLVIFETATPRSPHEIGGAEGGGAFAGVSDGLLYMGTQHVYDLQNAGVNPQPLINTVVPECIYESTHLEDFIVAAAGPNLIVTRVEKLTDRDPSTSLTGADTVSLAAPAGTTVTSVQPYGNYLVLGELRADGAYLEVLDARPIRNRSMAAGWVWANQTRGSLRLVSYTPTMTQFSNAWVTVTLLSGRAFVGVDDPAQSVGFYVADLRQVVDDVAGGAITALGSASLSRIHSIAVKGNVAYVGTTGSGGSTLNTVDVTNAMTEPPTMLSSPTITGYNIPGIVQGLDVFGSYAVVFSRSTTGGIFTMDLSTTPKTVGYMPLAFQQTGCQVNSLYVNQRAKLKVSGTRAYVGGYDGLRVVELE